MPNVIVDVEQDDIDLAIKSNSTHCMISEAIKRVRPEWKRISTDLQTIRYTDRQGRRYVILTPPTAQRALLWFDQSNDALTPFTFRLPNPSQVFGPKKKGVKRLPQKATVKAGKKSGKGGHSAPVKIGGKAPPIGPLASEQSSVMKGKIRRYGLQRMGV